MDNRFLPVKITEHKNNGKLGGFLSINVFPGEYCEKMKENKSSICNQCYGYYMLNRYPRLKKALRFNSEVLSTRVLTSSECKALEKKINGKKNLVGLRFNSIGELINDYHVINLNNIAYEIDPVIPITLWTKRPNLLFKVLNTPLFKVVQSHKILNQFLFPEDCDDRVQHTFNVFDDETKMKDAMDFVELCDRKCIECHGKCNECMICYSHIDSTEPRYTIFELTKRAQRKKAKTNICPECQSDKVEPSWGTAGYMQCNNCGKEY